MNNGLFSGYYDEQKILGSQTIRLNGSYPGAGSGGCFIAPPEANYALISAMSFAKAAYTDGVSWWGPSGPACAYRVVFPLSRTIRYIPVMTTSAATLLIGSDGSSNLDQSSTYEDRTDNIPYLSLAGGGQGGANGGAAIFIDRYANQNITMVIANGGAYGGVGSIGGDGQVVQLRHGGLIAGGAGAGGGGLDDGAGGFTTPFRGGNVPAPWGTMQGGVPPQAGTFPPAGGGASLFMDGRSYASMTTATFDIPGHENSGYSSAAWVMCEYITTISL